MPSPQNFGSLTLQLHLVGLFLQHMSTYHNLQLHRIGLGHNTGQFITTPDSRIGTSTRATTHLDPCPIRLDHRHGPYNLQLPV